MVDDDTERSRLEAPKLFGRRRTTPAAAPAESDAPTFEDAGADAPVDLADPEPEVEVESAPRKPRKPRRGPRDRSVPLLPGRPAAAVSGVVGGLALVGFTSVGFRGCELFRGSSSCGKAPGMVALGLVFVLAVVVGGLALRYFKIPDPGPTSFLGTGLTAVICLLALVDHLDHWSMIIVIPAITAVTFLGSWWVTTTYVDADD